MATTWHASFCRGFLVPVQVFSSQEMALEGVFDAKKYQMPIHSFWYPCTIMVHTLRWAGKPSNAVNESVHHCGEGNRMYDVLLSRAFP